MMRKFIATPEGLRETAESRPTLRWQTFEARLASGVSLPCIDVQTQELHMQLFQAAHTFTRRERRRIARKPGRRQALRVPKTYQMRAGVFLPQGVALTPNQLRELEAITGWDRVPRLPYEPSAAGRVGTR